MAINHLVIDNFKSIYHLELNSFKRINLFIGRPNVGKSNIIEAISLFAAQFSKGHNSKKLNELVRLEHPTELFYDGNTEQTISIRINEQESRIKYQQELSFEIYPANSPLPNIANSIHRYIFTHHIKFKKAATTELLPPFGTNLLGVIEGIPELKRSLIQLLKTYDLQLVFDRASQSLKVMKQQQQGEIFLLPYSSIADTLQRLIFYQTAIASNQNAVLLFEEPEAHAFPPYMVHITQRIIDAKTNQFFINTHSPIVVNDFLENAIDDLAIFMVDLKEGKTVVKPLSDDEIKEVYDYGVDLFFNNEAYLQV